MTDRRTQQDSKTQRADSRDVPNYTLAEATYWLAIPANTIRNWFVGKSGMRPVLIPASRTPLALSFWNLVECSVLATIRKKHEISLPRVRKALQFVGREMGKERPLIQQSFETDNVELFVQNLGKLVCASQSGQLAIRELLAAGLQRIECDAKGLARRLSPWRTDPKEPQILTIDPTVAFGRPVLARTSVPAASIIDRYRAGESMDSLAHDFGVERDAIENLVRLFVPAAA